MSENFIGAKRAENGVYFRVWAPNASNVELLFTDRAEKVIMQRDDLGYFFHLAPSAEPGAKYMYCIDSGPPRPDPASNFQPEGVHGPSALIDHTFNWTDKNWRPPSLNESILYEMHVGTFTSEGTFESAIPNIPYLKDLGITTIQLMPVAQFPGKRNWGYDGVQLFAPHSAYGGPIGLKQFVNACHEQDLAVCLDVVYNHLGPEGNYLREFGPYFTDKYKSHWGECVNLDGPYSDEVRHFFIQNARYWLEYYHIDGLRLDATHALFDFSARPFLRELSTEVQSWAKSADRRVFLIAENDQSDRYLTLPSKHGGLGMDGQWLDDFHHAVHVALTQEDDGYYIDYQNPQLLHSVLKEGFAYNGQYSPFRKRRHGTSVEDLNTDRFIVSLQTHDQVGNRAFGDRLSHLTSFQGLKVAACLLATSPYTPMLFMGEEYGELAPFLYFVSHNDQQLIESVRQGRLSEFAHFNWDQTPPDPQSEHTFSSSKLNHTLRDGGTHAQLFSLYKRLLHLRKNSQALSNPERTHFSVSTGDTNRMICMDRRSHSEAFRILLNFDLNHEARISFDPKGVDWNNILDSEDPEWSTSADSTTPERPNHIRSNEHHTLTFSPASFAIYKSIVT